MRYRKPPTSAIAYRLTAGERQQPEGLIGATRYPIGADYSTKAWKRDRKQNRQYGDRNHQFHKCEAGRSAKRHWTLPSVT